MAPTNTMLARGTIMLLIFAGCTNGFTQDQPSPDRVPQAILSTERSTFESQFKGDYIVSSYIRKAQDSEGKVLYDANMFSEGLDELALDAGQYKLLIRCKSRNLTNAHVIALRAEQGQNYKAYCIGRYKDSLFGDKLVGMAAFISDVRTIEKDRKNNQDDFVGSEYKAGNTK